MAKVTDAYSNRSFIDITMSAANTITFSQLRFAVGTFQGVGLLLHKIDYYPLTSTIQEIVAAADVLQMGFTVRDDLTTLDPSNQAVISTKEYVLNRAATAEGEIHMSPNIDSFEGLPQGGLLIPPNPLYAAMNSAGFAAAGRFRAMLYYSFIQLSDRESVELLQTLLPGNV